jgi:hypothetical protein
MRQKARGYRPRILSDVDNLLSCVHVKKSNAVDTVHRQAGPAKAGPLQVALDIALLWYIHPLLAALTDGFNHAKVSAKLHLQHMSSVHFCVGPADENAA